MKQENRAQVSVHLEGPVVSVHPNDKGSPVGLRIMTGDFENAKDGVIPDMCVHEVLLFGVKDKTSFVERYKPKTFVSLDGSLGRDKMGQQFVRSDEKRLQVVDKLGKDNNTVVAKGCITRIISKNGQSAIDIGGLCVTLGRKENDAYNQIVENNPTDGIRFEATGKLVTRKYSDGQNAFRLIYVKANSIRELARRKTVTTQVSQVK